MVKNANFAKWDPLPGLINTGRMSTDFYLLCNIYKFMKEQDLDKEEYLIDWDEHRGNKSKDAK